MRKKLLLSALLVAPLSICIFPTYAKSGGDYRLGTFHTPIVLNSNGTYACGYDKLPLNMLKGCRARLPKDAPDLQGIWQDTSTGTKLSIEQCGDRIIISGNGVIHDMYVTGQVHGGVFDVAEADLPSCTIIRSYAKYKDGKTHELYQVTGKNDNGSKGSLVVTRTLVAKDTMRQDYGGTVSMLKRVKK